MAAGAGRGRSPMSPGTLASGLVFRRLPDPRVEKHLVGRQASQYVDPPESGGWAGAGWRRGAEAKRPPRGGSQKSEKPVARWPSRCLTFGEKGSDGDSGKNYRTFLALSEPRSLTTANDRIRPSASAQLQTQLFRRLCLGTGLRLQLILDSVIP